MNIKEAFESLAKVTSKGMKNPFFVIRGLYQAFNEIAEGIQEEIPSADKIPFDKEGTTLTSDDVEGAIKEIVTESTTTVSVSEGITTSRNVISRIGTYTTLSMRVNKITPNTKGWMVIGTIPEGYRPKRDVDFICTSGETNTQYLVVAGDILSTGEVRIWGIPDVGVSPNMTILFQN